MAGKRINSKIKGKIGELSWARFLKDNCNVEARRGAQYSGNSGSPDVVSDDIFYWEVKRRDTLNVYEAVNQAVKDSDGSGKVPAVAWRKDRQEWLVIIRAKDLPRVTQPLILGRPL